MGLWTRLSLADNTVNQKTKTTIQVCWTLLLLTQVMKLLCITILKLVMQPI